MWAKAWLTAPSMASALPTPMAATMNPPWLTDEYTSMRLVSLTASANTTPHNAMTTPTQMSRFVPGKPRARA